jgi:hypothetical protein
MPGATPNSASLARLWHDLKKGMKTQLRFYEDFGDDVQLFDAYSAWHAWCLAALNARSHTQAQDYTSKVRCTENNCTVTQAQV